MSIIKPFACEKYLLRRGFENVLQIFRFKSQSFNLSTTLNGELPQFYCHLREMNKINSHMLQVRLK